MWWYLCKGRHEAPVVQSLGQTLVHAMQIYLRHVCILVILIGIRAVYPQIRPSSRALHAALDIQREHPDFFRPSFGFGLRC